jgi:hypothetical protein
MMQYVTCNNFSLFAPRLIALEKQGKDKYPWGANKFCLTFLKWETLIHSYMKLRHEKHCNANWIKFNLHSTKFNSNSIEDKWDVNQWKKYSRSSYEYSVAEKQN